MTYYDKYINPLSATVISNSVALSPWCLAPSEMIRPNHLVKHNRRLLWSKNFKPNEKLLVEIDECYEGIVTY